MKNMPASVRARLLNLARKQGVPFQRLLTLYNQEGLLHRIVSTEYENSIFFKRRAAVLLTPGHGRPSYEGY